MDCICLAAKSDVGHDDRSRDEDSVCIPNVSGGGSSRLLSEFHILSEIGRGAFGDVIKVLSSWHMINTLYC